jgi:uncharacterized protein (TIGR00730 family)
MSSNKQTKSKLITAGEVVDYRDSWRIFRIMSEFVEGYQFLEKFKKEVAILGSARLPETNKYYKLAVQLGRLLGKNGFATLTGGGPGIMEAGNKGAHEVGGVSVGLNIQLPFEQRINPYVKDAVAFHYFFTRKVMLTSPAHAFAFFPGGFGTLDEFFEVVDYMEIGQMDKGPIALVGGEFWNPLLEFIDNKSKGEVNAVNDEDIAPCTVVETAEQAFEIVNKAAKERNKQGRQDYHGPLRVRGTDWKVFHIMAELVEGFEFLSKTSNGKDVTILGTKSIQPGSYYYQAAEELGGLLAKNGFGVVTGGGPGIMEAANKGAFENGGSSIGVDMRFEEGKERGNNYLSKSIGFVYPYIRKLMITSPSKAFVFFPGGFGTLHQLFEILTLLETKKRKPMPVILFGREFWQPLLDFIHHDLHLKFKTIGKLDEKFLKVTDNPKDVLASLR